MMKLLFLCKKNGRYYGAQLRDTLTTIDGSINWWLSIPNLFISSWSCD